MDLQGRTLAKRLKVRRRVKFSETWPFPTEAVMNYGIHQQCEMLTWRRKRTLVR